MKRRSKKKKQEKEGDENSASEGSEVEENSSMEGTVEEGMSEEVGQGVGEEENVGEDPQEVEELIQGQEVEEQPSTSKKQSKGGLTMEELLQILSQQMQGMNDSLKQEMQARFGESRQEMQENKQEINENMKGMNKDLNDKMDRNEQNIMQEINKKFDQNKEEISKGLKEIRDELIGKMEEMIAEVKITKAVEEIIDIEIQEKLKISIEQRIDIIVNKNEEIAPKDNQIGVNISDIWMNNEVNNYNNELINELISVKCDTYDIKGVYDDIKIIKYNLVGYCGANINDYKKMMLFNRNVYYLMQEYARNIVNYEEKEEYLVIKIGNKVIYKSGIKNSELFIKHFNKEGILHVISYVCGMKFNKLQVYGDKSVFKSCEVIQAVRKNNLKKNIINNIRKKYEISEKYMKARKRNKDFQSFYYESGSAKDNLQEYNGKSVVKSCKRMSENGRDDLGKNWIANVEGITRFITTTMKRSYNTNASMITQISKQCEILFKIKLYKTVQSKVCEHQNMLMKWWSEFFLSLCMLVIVKKHGKLKSKMY